MLKTYKYRIYPSNKQKRFLNNILEECRWLYNHLLSERICIWKDKKESISCFSQMNSLKSIKKNRQTIKGIYSQVLQNVVIRVDLSFKSFFRRCKSGEKPGHPRFKGTGWYDSFTYPQCPESGSPFNVGSTHINLAKIGLIKIIKHREMFGSPKTCTIKRTPTGKWFVSIVCNNIPINKLHKINNKIGIDVGLKTFAVLSNGERINNPRFFKEEEKKIIKIQRRFSKNNTSKNKKSVALRYEKVGSQRKDFCHKLSRNIINKYNVICVEDLNIKNMVIKGKKPKLSKSINDAAWGLFLNILFVKAESAGRTVIKVNPAYTTQDCSNCGNRQVMKLSTRQYECYKCGLSIDRDLNAAKNILSVGLHTLAYA